MFKLLCRIDTYCSTSPSLYLQLIGTAAVSDQCTTVGPNLISPIITLSPGELSTWKPRANEYSYYDEYFTVGEIWQDPSQNINVDIADGIAQLNFNDLACPTWGLGRSTAANGTVITTIGPPWLPLIVAPIEVFSLDPTWASVCTGMFNMQFYSTTVALFDPPTALMPAPLLAPTSLARPTPTPIPTSADPTTVPERATSYAEAAKPASLPNDPAAPPARTGDPGKESPSKSPVVASANPAFSPQNSAASSKNKGDPPANPPLDPEISSIAAVAGDPPSDPPSNPKVSSVSAVAGDLPANPPSKPKVPSGSAVSGDPPAESIAPSSTAPDPPPDPKVPSVSAVAGDAPADPPSDPKLPSASAVVGNSPAESIAPSSTARDRPSDPKVPNVSVPPPGEDPQSQSRGLGAIIYNAFGRSGPDVETPPNKVYTVAGQTFTSNPSAFPIAGIIVSAGGPPVTVDGTIINLDPSGALAIGSSTIDLPSLSDPSPSKVYTVAGQTFTPNPSAFSIANSVISADGPAATINGTIISLEPSGTLLIGSSTIPLSTTSDISIDGFDINAQSSFIIVDGVTLSAAAAGVTISGTLVSFEAGGATLDIGTGRFALPTATTGAANGSVNVQAFTGGQEKGRGLSLAFMCGVCGIVVLLTV